MIEIQLKVFKTEHDSKIQRQCPLGRFKKHFFRQIIGEQCAMVAPIHQ